MAQIGSVKVINSSAAKNSESYEVKWTIPYWTDVRKDPEQLNRQRIYFETTQNPHFSTKWAVGFKTVTYGFQRRARLCWQLLDMKDPTKKLDAVLKTHMVYDGSKINCSEERSVQLSTGEIFEIASEYLDIPLDEPPFSQEFAHGDGALKYTLGVTISLPKDPNILLRHKLEEFAKKSQTRVRHNYSDSLLKNSGSSDLKVVTKDGIEISAHQTILKIQWPKFYDVHKADIAKSSDSLQIDDISGKTMNILLNYIYTGDLSPSWRDEEVVLEFVYAAGKYELVQVLNLLDNILGLEKGHEVVQLDMKLAKLVGSLGLKQAEQRLLHQIQEKIKRLKTSDELFDLFEFKKESVFDNTKKNDSEIIGESTILEIWDYSLGNSEHQHLLNGRCLKVLALIQKKGTLVNVESNLLARFAETASKLNSAAELFAFFGN